jgi:GNAT superfamily N-acetyltransferase
MNITHQPVTEQDFDTVLGMRLAAMRPSLEVAGRFDEQRARERLESTFDPLSTRFILCDGQRVGVETSYPEGATDWRLMHLYIEPAHQGKGIGSLALEYVKMEAQIAQRHIVVETLTGSRANQFYERHGFLPYAQSEWDTHYRYTVEMFD